MKLLTWYTAAWHEATPWGTAERWRRRAWLALLAVIPALAVDVVGLALAALLPAPASGIFVIAMFLPFIPLAAALIYTVGYLTAGLWELMPRRRRTGPPPIESIP